MLLSINQLWDLTGRERKTVTKKLENLTFIAGEKSAHLYESSQALPLIYSVDNLEAARAKQALSQASLNALREEDLRKLTRLAAMSESPLTQARIYMIPSVDCAKVFAGQKVRRS